MSNICIVKIYPYGSPEYTQTLEMRNRITRLPHNQSLFTEDLTLEKDYIHFIAKDIKTDKIIGTVILIPLNEKLVKLKQMMVEEEFRKLKIGTFLINNFEQYCKSKGIEKIKLDSIITATNFYKKLGYYCVSDECLVMGLPHFLMEKTLV